VVATADIDIGPLRGLCCNDATAGALSAFSSGHTCEVFHRQIGKAADPSSPSDMADSAIEDKWTGQLVFPVRNERNTMNAQEPRESDAFRLSRIFFETFPFITP